MTNSQVWDTTHSHMWDITSSYVWDTTHSHLWDMTHWYALKRRDMTHPCVTKLTDDGEAVPSNELPRTLWSSLKTPCARATLGSSEFVDSRIKLFTWTKGGKRESERDKREKFKVIRILECTLRLGHICASGWEAPLWWNTWLFCQNIGLLWWDIGLFWQNMCQIVTTHPPAI